MNELPKISIVTTYFNSVKLGDFVNRSMECLLNQTYKNIEFICVNDGSEDSTLSQLEEYARLDSRIVIVNKKNEGVAQYAKGAGQEKATGNWVMLFDHDDLLSLDAIEKAVRITKKHPELEAVSMMINVLYADGKSRVWYNLDKTSKTKMSAEFRRLSGYEFYKNTVGRYDVHFRGIIKREKFQSVSYRYDEKLVNGDEIVERLIFKKLDYIGVCSGVYSHFIYDNSSAKSYSLKKIDIVRTDVILREMFQDENIYDERQEIFEIDAYKSLVTGVKIYNRLKNKVNKTTQNLYYSKLKEGYDKLNKPIVIQQFSGISKIYNQLILSHFNFMLNFYKIKN